MTTDDLADHVAAITVPEDLPYIVAALSERVSSLEADLLAMQEREQWHRRCQVATAEQRLAVLRQVAMPQLLEQIREGGA